MIPDATIGTTLVPLTATETGYVSPTSGMPPNTVAVTGSWYAYGDSWGTEGVEGGVGVAGERGNCQLIGGFPTSDCSTITSPLPPAPQVDAGMMMAATDGGEAGAAPPPPMGYANGFPPTPAGSQTFCLSGTGAAVIMMDGGTSPDYSDIYGIGMGFDFNNVGGVKSIYNAPANNVIGVEFTIAAGNTTFPTVRVEFPTTDTNDAGAEDSYVDLPIANGAVKVLWSQLETPYPPVAGTNVGYAWPTTITTFPMFNPAHLLSIQFHIPTAVGMTAPVMNLCVSNLTAIVQAPAK
jgi:hypothetical protein